MVFAFSDCRRLAGAGFSPGDGGVFDTSVALRETDLRLARLLSAPAGLIDFIV